MTKRHLIILSHDHHHGLVLAWRLRQGERALLTDGWTHDRKEKAKRVQEFYRESLKLHFKAEEEALFPMIAEHIPTSSTLVKDLVNQHRMIEGLVSTIAQADGDSLNQALIELGTLLEHHIRSEERELFPLFEREMPAPLKARVDSDVERVHTRVDVSGTNGAV